MARKNTLIDENKDEEVKSILSELSKSNTCLKNPEDLSKYIIRLCTLYNNGYRHMYSNIFSTLTDIDSTSNNLDILAENLNILYLEYIKSNNSDKSKQSVRKLYDHVNLDISRINYMKKIESGYNKNNENINKTINESKKEIEKLSKNINKSQRDYITILGIFATIVLAFVSGITFSTSVFENMSNISIYRLVLVCLIIGLVFITLLFSLLNFLLWINKDEDNFMWLILQKNLKLRYIYVFFITAIILDLFAWLFDIVENKIIIKSILFK